MSRRTLAPLAAALLSLGTSPAPAQPAPLPDVRDLPLVEVPPRAASTRRPADGTLVLLVTGDGEWAALDQGVARVLVDSGAAVVALKARSYLLGGARTPDAMARDAERVLRRYLATWGRDRIALVGYSRGADLLPFVAARLPDDLRARVSVLAMLGLSTTASFRFHWSDLVTDRARESDFPVAPALERLRGLRMLCVFGAEERDSGCRGASPSLVTRVERPGGHHFDGDFAALGALVARAIGGGAVGG